MKRKGVIRVNDPWKSKSEGMICVTCMWYVEKGVRTHNDHKIGRCRRHAPSISGYPVVFEIDWCGDHRLDTRDDRNTTKVQLNQSTKESIN